VTEETITEEFTRYFASVLNRHGYGFQFSVLKKANELARQNKSPWRLEACEFPVEGGAGTRIDFVLSRPPRRYDGLKHYFLIAECKRANPALSNWCFARAPFTRQNASPDKSRDKLIVECLLREDDGLKTFARGIFESLDVYHLAFEVRSNAKGDPSGETGQAIENAATQVSRSLNGFIHTLFREPQLIEGYRQLEFLPVIFTTANLFVTETDLSLANLETGNLELATEDVKRVSWLFYQYPLSPALKHPIAMKIRGDTIGALLEYGFLRTIAIVSPNGIEEFLGWATRLETRL
jgi:hypothetical protein